MRGQLEAREGYRLQNTNRLDFRRKRGNEIGLGYTLSSPVSLSLEKTSSSRCSWVNHWSMVRYTSTTVGRDKAKRTWNSEAKEKNVKTNNKEEKAHPYTFLLTLIFYICALLLNTP